MNITPREELIPLTPQSFHVLLALAEKPMYGYGIIEQCELDAEGAIAFDSGTIYKTISRLKKMGLIEHRYEEYGHGSPNNRKYLALTPTGQLALELESSRFRSLSHLAQHRLTILSRRASTLV